MTVNVENYFESPGVGKENRPFIAGSTVPTKAAFAFAPFIPFECHVTITLQDGKGSPILSPVLFNVHLSDAATGTGLTSVGSQVIAVQGASGADIGVLTAKKALVVQTLADGTYILKIIDPAKSGFYIAVYTPFGGLVSVSRQLQTSDYGA